MASVLEKRGESFTPQEQWADIESWKDGVKLKDVHFLFRSGRTSYNIKILSEISKELKIYGDYGFVNVSIRCSSCSAIIDFVSDIPCDVKQMPEDYHVDFYESVNRVKYQVDKWELEAEKAADCIDNIDEKIGSLNLNDSSTIVSAAAIEILNPKTQEIILATTSSSLNHMKNTLNSTEYMLMSHRSYMQTLIRNLEPNLADKTEVLETSRYINRFIRKMLLTVLNKWMDIIVEVGNRPSSNPFFLKNSLVNPVFAKFLKEIDGRCSFPLGVCNRFVIYGSVSEVVFYYQMKLKYPNSLETFENLKMSYTNSVRKNENFKFGDPFSWNFCDNVAKAM